MCSFRYEGYVNAKDLAHSENNDCQRGIWRRPLSTVTDNDNPVSLEIRSTLHW